MALTPLRWVAAAIAGCLMLSVAILRFEPPRFREPEVPRQLERRAERLGGRASTIAGRLHFLQLMDSAGIGGSAAANVPPVRVMLDTAIPGDYRSVLDSLGWRSVRHVLAAGVTGVDIVFLYDTLQTLRGAGLPRRYGAHMDYVLPSRAGERCAVVARIGFQYASKRKIAGLFRSDAAVEALAGPCAFYRAFGMPGPQVEAWLRARGWSFAGGGSWTQRSASADVAEDWNWHYQSQLSSVLRLQSSLPFFSAMGAEGVQCAAGQLDACDHAVLGRPQRGGPVVWNGNILYNSYPSLDNGRYYESYRSFGHREATLLADMVRTLGRERFGKFWTSVEPVPVAFQQAAGESLDGWTARWIVDQYGPLPPRGAGVNALGGAMSLLFIVLSLAIALRVSAKRQFA